MAVVNKTVLTFNEYDTEFEVKPDGSSVQFRDSDDDVVNMTLTITEARELADALTKADGEAEKTEKP